MTAYRNQGLLRQKWLGKRSKEKKWKKILIDIHLCVGLAAVSY